MLHTSSILAHIFLTVPNPVFGMTMYTVPEDDPGSVPLCVDIGVDITEPLTYRIETGQKIPPQAEGLTRSNPIRSA